MKTVTPTRPYVVSKLRSSYRMRSTSARVTASTGTAIPHLCNPVSPNWRKHVQVKFGSSRSNWDIWSTCRVREVVVPGRRAGLGRAAGLPAEARAGGRGAPVVCVAHGSPRPPTGTSRSSSRSPGVGMSSSPHASAHLLPSHSRYARQLRDSLLWACRTQPVADRRPARWLGTPLGGGAAVLAAGLPRRVVASSGLGRAPPAVVGLRRRGTRPSSVAVAASGSLGALPGSSSSARRTGSSLRRCHGPCMTRGPDPGSSPRWLGIPLRFRRLVPPWRLRVRLGRPAPGRAAGRRLPRSWGLPGLGTPAGPLSSPGLGFGWRSRARPGPEPSVVVRRRPSGQQGCHGGPGRRRACAAGR